MMLYPYRNSLAVLMMVGYLTLLPLLVPKSAFAEVGGVPTRGSSTELVNYLAGKVTGRELTLRAWQRRVDAVVMSTEERWLYLLDSESETEGGASLEERQIRTDFARAETARIITTLLLETEPARQLRRMLQFLTRPIEVSQLANGEYQTSYFGVGEKASSVAAAPTLTVFALSYSISDRNRFSLRAHFYERFIFSAYGNNSFDLRYRIGQNAKIGLVTEGSQEGYLVYTVSF